MNTAENRAHWDKQAALGATAGTQDLILKQLEQRAILQAIHNPQAIRILEVGCGRGETARKVFEDCWTSTLLAIDSSPEMIAHASEHANTSLRFEVGDVMDPPQGPFDIIYSQRCLINLPSWEAQKQAIDAIADRLVPGGKFLMCEHSQDGFDFINDVRVDCGLEPMPVVMLPDGTPRNRYLRDGQLGLVRSLRLVECQCFSSNYYFLSRIVNARLAQDRGDAPQYDSEINRLALSLEPDLVDPRFAQGRLWVWQKPA